MRPRSGESFAKSSERQAKPSSPCRAIQCTQYRRAEDTSAADNVVTAMVHFPTSEFKNFKMSFPRCHVSPFPHL